MTPQPSPESAIEAPGLVFMAAYGDNREVRGMFDTAEQAHAFVKRLAETMADIVTPGGGLPGDHNGTRAALASQAAAPTGWLYDWMHSSALGKPDEHFTSFTTDEAHARKHENVRTVWAQAAAPEQPPTVQWQDGAGDWHPGVGPVHGTHPIRVRDSVHQAQPSGCAATAQPNVRDWIADLLRRWNEAYPRMDIYSPPGTVVMFDGRGGYEGEQEDARAKLSMRGLYEVKSISVGSCSSTVSLVGVKGRFNTVLFAQAPTAPGLADNVSPMSDKKESVAALPVQQWQDISTAPKDCEIVGAEWQSPGDNYPMDLMTQKTMYRNGKWRYPSGIAWNPTHWMPLPPPPVDQGEQQ